MMPRLLTKLTLLTIFLALSSLGLAAQVVVVPGEPEPPTPEKRNEVRWNVYAPVVHAAISIEYERVILLNVGVGAMASTYFGKNHCNDIFFPTVGVMPYGRWYFGGRLVSISKPNAGFFLEANSSIAYNDKLRNVYYNIVPNEFEIWYEETSGISWGIGLGAGFKFITRSNWSGEVSLRLGRNLVKASNRNGGYIYPAVSVGYRF